MACGVQPPGARSQGSPLPVRAAPSVPLHSLEQTRVEAVEAERIGGTLEGGGDLTDGVGAEGIGGRQEVVRGVCSESGHLTG